MTRQRWVIDRNRPEGQRVVKAEERLPDPGSPAPYIMRDMEPYRNVIDGKVISGRRQHRDFLRAHGVTEVGNETVQPQQVEPDRQDRRRDIHRAMIETGYIKQ